MQVGSPEDEVQRDGTNSSSQAQQRTRKACDACRSRKTKCFYDGEACRACIGLSIPCTQKKPRKKRGPANQYLKSRHEEALQREANSSATALPPIIISPQNVSIGTSAVDQLAAPETIHVILNDWFGLIHSVCPIHHRANFLRRLNNGDASRDPEFAAVVIALCAATVSSLPRKAALDYPLVTVKRCMDIITSNRLLDDQERITLAFCQAKYHLSTSMLAEQGADSAINYRLSGEVVGGLKYLTFYELPHMPPVEQELTKRLYWLMFCGLCTTDMYNRPSIGLLSPQQNIQTFQPLSVTDSELDSTNIDPYNRWHGDSMTYIPGLNYLCRLFLLWHSSQQLHPPTLAHLQHYMTLVQRALETLPHNLRWRGGLSRPLDSNFGTDVQTANLYITQLHIRSSLLEQMHTLLKSQGPMQQDSANFVDEVQIRMQRATIVTDLLEILHHMSEETLEANGYSLIPKARDIGSALLDEMRMGIETGGGDAQRASADLKKLLEKLEHLDYLHKVV